MTDFVQSLMIDSKFRTSGTGSNFTIELADNLQCNSTTQCAVTAVSFPASMFTVEFNVNDKLYLLENYQNIVNCRVLQLQTGQWDGQSFSDMLETVLNGADRIAGSPNYEVFWAAAEGRMVLQWGSAATPNRSWQFLSDADLIDGSFWMEGTLPNLVPGPPYNKERLMSSNNVIRLEEEPGLLSLKPI